MVDNDDAEDHEVEHNCPGGLFYKPAMVIEEGAQFQLSTKRGREYF